MFGNGSSDDRTPNQTPGAARIRTTFRAPGGAPSEASVRSGSRVIFVCQTENNLYTKEVRVLDSANLTEQIHSLKDHLEYWVGINRDGETLVRWWVEDEDCATVEDFGTDLSVNVNEHGKLKMRR